ncbi:MAG: LysR family transcriptional regulator [Candidimonas sp.]
MNIQKVSSLWTHLYWLTILDQQGSFTSAAARLNVSKAAISLRIAELEKAAGVALVRRTTRSVQLTEAGRQLVENTRHAFDQIAQSFSGIQELADTPRGALRVTVPVAFARQQLVPRLPGFIRAYPDVRIELDLSDRLVSLAGEGFDLALRHVAAPPDTHVAWPLCSTRSVLVASPAYLQRHGSPSHPETLARHRCLHYPRPKGTATWTFELAGGRDASPERLTVPIRSAFSANNSEVLRDVALEGEGIALAPDFSVQSALRQGSLVEILPDWRPEGAFGDKIYAIRPYASHVPQAVQVFVAYLRSAFQDGFDT